jgi:hypothetical protein
MSMMQMFPTAFGAVIGLTLAALAVMLISGRRRHGTPWRVGYLITAVLHGTALAVTVVTANQSSWFAGLYLSAGLQATMAGSALCLGAAWRRVGATPPGCTQDFPAETA